MHTSTAEASNGYKQYTSSDNSVNEDHSDNPPSETQTNNTESDTNEDRSSVSVDQENNDSVVITRSGRRVKKPKKYLTLIFLVAEELFIYFHVLKRT